MAKKTSKTEKLGSKEKDFKALSEAHGRLNKRLRLIQGMADLFLDVTSVERNVEAAMDFVMGAVDAEAGSILLVDDEKKQLYFASARGPKAKEIKNIRLHLGIGLAGACVKGKETIAVSDVRKDPRFSREIDRTLGFETRSVLAAPVVFRSTALGAVEVVNKRANDVFTAEEIELVKQIARLLGALLAIGDRLRE